MKLILHVKFKNLKKLKFTQLNPLSLHDSQTLSPFESQSSFPVQTDNLSAIFQLQTQTQQKLGKLNVQ